MNSKRGKYSLNVLQKAVKVFGITTVFSTCPIIDGVHDKMNMQMRLITMYAKDHLILVAIIFADFLPDLKGLTWR